MGNVETGFDKCSVKNCAFPQGECIVIQRAKALASGGNLTAKEWGIIKPTLFNELDNCAKKEESIPELEKISPETYLEKKDKLV